MAIVTDVSVLALLLFAPLVYAVILSRRDQPAQRVLALIQGCTALVKVLAELAKALDALTRRLGR